MEDSNTKMVVGFAFNDFDFSYRILRVEIVPFDHSNDLESYEGAKVVTLHISSPILASKSRFFYKLFKNGMRESQHKNDVSLRIYASEEAALMDLLNFMYGNTLSATSALDLINVLIVADKFEVTSCMRYSIQMLLKLPMSLENALLYLELPSSVLVSDVVQPLIDEAKKYIVVRYKDFTKFQEMMKLPLSAIEVVLGGVGLQVASEDDVFDFILKWARVFYPELEERREILTQRLARLICFPNMSCSKLKEVLVCPDFKHVQVSKLVVEAIFFKAELSCGKHILASKDLTTTNLNFSRRVYNPSFSVHFDRCVVYFNLKREECANLFPSKCLYSPQFCLSGKQLHLSAECEINKHRFGLFVYKGLGTETCTIDFELAVMKKSSKKFKSRSKVKNHTLEDDYGWGFPDMLKISWVDFMSDDCDYFINDILHLRAEITLVNNS